MKRKKEEKRRHPINCRGLIRLGRLTPTHMRPDLISQLLVPLEESEHALGVGGEFFGLNRSAAAESGSFGFSRDICCSCHFPIHPLIPLPDSSSNSSSDLHFGAFMDPQKTFAHPSLPFTPQAVFYSDSISTQPLTSFVGHGKNISQHVLFIQRDGNHNCASEGVKVFLEHL
ncbi:hypothetical protein CDAR_200391 [Caerostris darwini]|uniref:Uncharacterized protein n=1 Tax=Caerostris darwini TaxID=1538125 RepID=A0AAV4MIN7_9ARAC|nr:hypothetical protein CDAR_200391 [Caerostris darwini]